MATADRDGKLAQIVADMHTCLGMELAESMREAQRAFDAEMAALKDNEPEETP